MKMRTETKKKIAKALRAMKDIGISEDKVKPVLKSLLKVFEDNWKLIEEDNYRALADSIFERQEAEKDDLLEEEAQRTKEPERPLKRLRPRHQDGQASTLNTHDRRVHRTSIAIPKEEPNEQPKTHLPRLSGSQGILKSSQLNLENKRHTSHIGTCQSLGTNKGKKPTSPKSLIANEKHNHVQSNGLDRVQENNAARVDAGLPHPMRLRDRGKVAVCSQSTVKKSTPKISSDVKNSKEPNIECGIDSGALIKPKDDASQKEDRLTRNGMNQKNHRPEHPASQTAEKTVARHGNSAANEWRNKGKLTKISENLKESVANGEHQEDSTQEMDGLRTNMSPRDIIDIAKGLEKTVITLANEVNDECPPSFFYIPKNAVFQNAYLNFSLARMGDRDSCSACSGDCLSLSIPCACSYETGGEFAYTTDGLVKEEFLNECISMNRNPKNRCQFFCKECVLERSKNEDVVEPCKGHLVRKFIKECWWKCGCNHECGNRVVQRGITRKLQVFMTSEAKGWGLRTLEDLPKGAFVCEYVGEVLTNAEFFDRVQRSSKGDKHSYPVLLDANWGAEEVLKDEEALCLDATYYGNVARFINHKCYDPNMVEIPVEVETPDHHYYHLAFFTTRKVKALEELTWDYAIDFDDHDHPIKAFECQCRSKFCRNNKRSTRSRSSRRL